MSNFFNLGDGVVVEVIMPREQGSRLAGTCFRGTHCREAGNFFAWENFSEFITDVETRELLAAELKRLVEEGQVNRRHRLHLRFKAEVGWSSTVNQSELLPEKLAVCEIRQVNRRAKALFLPENILAAPRTDLVTMALRMFHDGRWKFVMGTIYPGEDIGELRGRDPELDGDLTEERGIVFLSWANIGA